ncbi:MAG: thioredoxin family protein [Deltaproteobacteria bacterium]|nr:thioredoxin family protein [Deltaproteobacteria bacterium]
MTTLAPGAHPHFNDRGAIQWYTSLSDALVAAKTARKKVFIEFGREACTDCRALVEGAIPQEAVKARLNESFIAVAADCDEPDPALLELWRHHMPWARSLPFVFYVDENGAFLHGTTGSRSASELLGDLEEVAHRR